MPGMKRRIVVEMSSSEDSGADSDYETESRDEWSSGLESEYDGEQLEDSDSESGSGQSDHGGPPDLSEESDSMELDDVYEDSDLDVPERIGASGADQAAVDDVAQQIRQFDTTHQALPLGDDFVDVDDLHDGNIHSKEHYRQGIVSTVDEDYRRKVYAKGTERLIVHTENQWNKYCEDILESHDYVGSLARLTFPVLKEFLRWYLGQRVNKNGQRKRRVQAGQSLITFWCNFRLHVQRTLNLKVDKLVDRQLVCNLLAKLRTVLKHNTRANKSMTINDLKLQIETTLKTTEKAFRLGEVRVLACLFLLLLAPQGSRPASILQLQYKHIGIRLIRDPKSPEGPVRLVIQLSLEFTKRYLGPKAMKTFIMPEIIYDPSLCLSPHVFLLAILIQQQAFRSPDINRDPNLLGTMRIVPGDNEIRLALRPEIQDQYVFRRPVNTVSGWQMGKDPIPLPTMCNWIRRIGMLAGFESNTIAYSLRYMAGNSLDQNVNISEALRNLVMDHAPNSDTFQRHYLNRFVCADLMAIHRGLDPAVALIQQATSHGASASSRRPTVLTAQQSRELKNDHHYQALTRRMSHFRKKSEQFRRLHNKRRSHWERIYRLKLEEVREKWSDDQGVEDVARFVRGEGADTSEPTSQTMRPLQQKAADALEAPLVNEYVAQLKRRTAAVLALAAFCGEEDPVANKVVRVGKKARVDTSLTPEEMMEAMKRSTLAQFAGKRGVLRCFLCVAKAETLGVKHPSFDKLCWQFSRQGTLARHFISCHLDLLKADQMYECGMCHVTLIHKKHVQNHAHKMHGISTDITYRRPSKKRSTE